MNAVLEQLQKIGIVPVVVINDAYDAKPLAEALIKGGLPCAEVTFRTAAAEESIRIISQSLPRSREIRVRRSIISFPSFFNFHILTLLIFYMMYYITYNIQFVIYIKVHYYYNTSFHYLSRINKILH